MVMVSRIFHQVILRERLRGGRGTCRGWGWKERGRERKWILAWRYPHRTRREGQGQVGGERGAAEGGREGREQVVGWCGAKKEGEKENRAWREGEKGRRE